MQYDLFLSNAGNMAHAMHLHGDSFTIIATNGNPVPEAARLDVPGSLKDRHGERPHPSGLP